MSYSIITNIKHFIPENPTADMPAPARKLRDFLGNVIMAATSCDEAQFSSAMPCRKRGCRGTITIKRQDLPQKAILWHCSNCDDGGAVTNWQETYFDFTRKSTKHVTEEDPELEIFISVDEHSALRSGRFYDQDCDRMIYGAHSTPKGILVRGLESDFDNFVGFLAADANHEKKIKRRNFLDAVYEKASGALDDSLLRHEDLERVLKFPTSGEKP